MKTPLVLVATTVLLFNARAFADETNTPIPGIGPIGEVVALHTGFKFTEGPAADAAGNIYFTDIPNNRIHKIATDRSLSTFLENTEGTNGLAFDVNGRLIGCNAKTKRLVAVDMATKEVSTAADNCDGEPLVGLNDLVIDREGGIYCTGPVLGKPKSPELGSSVFYVSPAAEVTRLPMQLVFPNGISLSPDEKTLYVLPYVGGDLMAYKITSPGKVDAGRVFCKVEQREDAKSPAGGDGMTVDTKGNLYLTVPSIGAIQVVDPNGKTLGLIHLPLAPANCAFGGTDMKTLYITARTTVFAAKMEVPGRRFAAGSEAAR